MNHALLIPASAFLSLLALALPGELVRRLQDGAEKPSYLKASGIALLALLPQMLTLPIMVGLIPSFWFVAVPVASLSSLPIYRGLLGASYGRAALMALLQCGLVCSLLFAALSAYLGGALLA